MGDIGFEDKNQGLAYLVAVVSEIERAQLTREHPDAAAAIDACQDPEQASRIATEAGMTTPAVEALNEALALEIGLERLVNALQVAQLPRKMRSAAVSMLAEDALNIALSAVVDAVRRTLEATFALYLPIPDKRARTLRYGWRTWTKKAKADLSPMREPIAHAESFHLTDFGNLKIWESALLLRAGDHALMQFVASGRPGASHEALERRVGRLRDAAVLLIAKVFAECGALAALIERDCLPADAADG